MSQTGKKKVLVTGASGFIGSFMVSDGLDRGYEMWAGMRRSSSKQYLTDGRIKFAELDLGNPNRLREQLLGYKSEMGGGWDYVIHAAGATKSLKYLFSFGSDAVQHLALRLLLDEVVLYTALVLLLCHS